MLTPEDQEIWEGSNRSFFILAGLQWKILMENTVANGLKIGARYTDVRYEDIVASPVETLRKIIKWAGLNETDGFYNRIKSIKILNQNRKWETEVNPAEIDHFNSLLGPTLERFGYS